MHAPNFPPLDFTVEDICVVIEMCGIEDIQAGLTSEKEGERGRGKQQMLTFAYPIIGMGLQEA